MTKRQRKEVWQTIGMAIVFALVWWWAWWFITTYYWYIVAAGIIGVGVLGSALGAGGSRCLRCGFWS